MNVRQVLQLYDDDYAREYDQKFLLNRSSKIASDREIELVRQLLKPGGKWLDVACGTGYVLSRFPGIPRAGLDVSPAMLARAREANPDALFLKQADFRVEVPEWEDEWALVTCMWYSYGIVESMADIHTVVKNLASWTSPDGACFIPLCDPHILFSRGIKIPYVNPNRFAGGHVLITAVVWSWIDEAGRQHQNMIAPHVEHMVAMFKAYFDVVDVVAYPVNRRWWGHKRPAIIARAKKRRGAVAGADGS